MNRFLVVGYGNTLRGDDGLGPLIAEKLADTRLPGDVEVRILSLPQLDISLVTELRDVDAVVFADARQDAEDDPIKLERIAAGEASPIAGHTTHTMGIAALLHLVQAWYGRHPDCYLVMPRGIDFSIGMRISPTGRKNAALAVAAIARILRHGLRRHDNPTASR